MPLDPLSSTFAALADPTRRAILARLALGETSVMELAEPFDMSLPAISKHLKVLEAGGWIESDKAGRIRTCRLKAETAKAAEGWLGQQRSLWEARLDRLDAFLANLPGEGENSDA